MAQQRQPEKEAELRTKIQDVTGITPSTPHDFDVIASIIFDRTKQRVSATTLKRFWKYIEKDNDAKTRVSILDVLCNFVGYTSWNAFCSMQADADGSDFVVAKELKSTDLMRGVLLRIVWDPERSITVRYDGGNKFTVLESVNSKLAQDDTFCCVTIVETMPLLLTQVVHNGMAPCSYICGRLGGVKVTIL